MSQQDNMICVLVDKPRIELWKNSHGYMLTRGHVVKTSKAGKKSIDQKDPQYYGANIEQPLRGALKLAVFLQVDKVDGLKALRARLEAITQDFVDGIDKIQLDGVKALMDKVREDD